MKILACNGNRPLAVAISDYLDLLLTKASVRRFSDMEVFVEIQENVRGEDVFVTKIAPNGGSLVYSTFLGGTDEDEGGGG